MGRHRKPRHSSHRATPPKRDHIEMVVYAIQAGEYVKVGIAEDIHSRLVVFKTHCPIPVEVVFCSVRMPRPQAREVEVSCHTSLIEHHAHGEWFKVEVEKALRVLRALCSQMPELSDTRQLKLVL